MVAESVRSCSAWTSFSSSCSLNSCRRISSASSRARATRHLCQAHSPTRTDSVPAQGISSFRIKTVTYILHRNHAFGFRAKLVAQAGDMLINRAGVDFKGRVVAPHLFQELVAREGLTVGED